MEKNIFEKKTQQHRTQVSYCSWQKITQLARTRLSSVMNEEMEVPFTVNRNQRKKWQRRKKSEEKYVYKKNKNIPPNSLVLIQC